MNDTQGVPGASLIPESTDIFTITVFALIALFAIGAIAIIVIGARRKRRRVAAEEVVQERIEQEAVSPPPPVPAAPPPPRIVAEPVSEPAPLADEPIAAASARDASPASEAASAPSGDDLAGDDPAGGPAGGPVTQLKGLGPKVASRLAELGITTLGDLAALSDDEAARLDAELGAFAGRMARDRWIEQARLLAAGDRAGFEAVFGKL